MLLRWIVSGVCFLNIYLIVFSGMLGVVYGVV